MSLLKPLGKLAVTTLIGILFSNNPALGAENSEPNIEGTWYYQGHFSGEGYGTTNEWGFGYFHLKQEGTNIYGKYKHEDIPVEYPVSGNISSNYVHLVVQVKDKPLELSIEEYEARDKNRASVLVRSQRMGTWDLSGKIKEKESIIEGQGTQWGRKLIRLDKSIKQKGL